MPAHSKGDAAKREIITLRVTSAKRAQLEEARRASGRSLSQEVEERLTLSLEQDKWSGSPENSLLLREIAGNLARVERIYGSWTKSRAAWSWLYGALAGIMENQMPPPDEDIWEANREKFINLLELAMAEAELNKKLDGLTMAYPDLWNYDPKKRGQPPELPPAIAEEYAKILAQQFTLGERLQKAVHELNETALREQRQRDRQAHEFGRRVARSAGRRERTNMLITDGVRFFFRDGKVEPAWTLTESHYRFRDSNTLEDLAVANDRAQMTAYLDEGMPPVFREDLGVPPVGGEDGDD